MTQVGQQAWFRRGFLLLLACLTAACQSDVGSFSPAASEPGQFAVVVGDGGHLAVLDVDGLRPIAYQGPKPSGGPFGGSPAVALDDDTVALLTGDILMIVDSSGQARSIRCEECLSLAWSGEQILVERRSQAEGNAFDVSFYSPSLKEKARRSFRPTAERHSSEAEQVEPAGGLLAASPEAFWMQHADRFGFTRGGSRTITAYDHRGPVVAATRVRGAIYEHALSPDGRYLAIVDGGSSGTCSTVGELDVIDLTNTTLLDTSPRIPPGAFAAVDQHQMGESTFALGPIWWQNSELVATGTYRQDSNCEGQEWEWTRRYDPTRQVFTDTANGTAPPPFSLGDDCVTVATREPGSQTLQLPSGDHVEPLFLPRVPDFCLAIS